MACLIASRRLHTTAGFKTAMCSARAGIAMPLPDAMLCPPQPLGCCIAAVRPGHFLWAKLHYRRLRLLREAGGYRLPRPPVPAGLLRRSLLALPMQRLRKLGRAACAPLLLLLLLLLLLFRLLLLLLPCVCRMPALLCLLRPFLLLLAGSTRLGFIGASKQGGIAVLFTAATLLPTLHVCLGSKDVLLIARLLQQLGAGCAAITAAIGLHHMQARVL